MGHIAVDKVVMRYRSRRPGHEQLEHVDALLRLDQRQRGMAQVEPSVIVSGDPGEHGGAGFAGRVIARVVE